MTHRSRPQFRDQNARPAEGNEDLDVNAFGAVTRRQRYWRDAHAFLFPVLVTAAFQACVYLAVFARAARSDWHNALLAVTILAFVPALAAVTLSAFRRNDAPISAAIAVVAVYFSFAVTFLSALRVPVSYFGLAAALPVAILIIAAANIRFHTALSARVAIIAFDGADVVINLLNDAGIVLITDPDADISQFDTVLTDPSHHATQWSDLLARCHVAGVEAVPWTRFLEIRLGRIDVSSFDVSHVTYTASQILYIRLKRVLDLIAIVITLPITLPLSVLTAIFIFLKDGYPVFFIQHRRGFRGRVFRMYKFRTMYRGTGGEMTTLGDKRIIRGARLIRKLRLDELPQLFNIMIGDMSLIGPRPVAEYVARASIAYERKYVLRTLVLPGITGWAQVTSGYAETTAEELEKLAYDLYYIKHLSFDLDLQILFRTIKTVLLGTGAR